MKTVGRQRNTIALILAGIVAGALFPIVALTYILSIRRKLHRASQPGREVSANISPTETPLTTVTRSGQTGDPINIQILGTDGQIGAAFSSAGWYRADEIDLITSARICSDSVLGRKYSTAPVSNLYLFGHKEDMAFERPGSNVRHRDHIRIWKTALNGNDGRPIWIGSATKDTKVELARTNHLPTHHISPEVDDERDLVVSELAETGLVIGNTTRPGFGKETQSVNGGGDPYFTDGQVAVLTMANLPIPPLASNIHHPSNAHIVSLIAEFIRDHMAEDGHDHTIREQEHPTQSTQVNT